MGADIRHGLETQVELPVEAPWTVEHVYHLFVVRVRQADRDQVLKALHDGGVGAGMGLWKNNFSNLFRLVQCAYTSDSSDQRGKHHGQGKRATRRPFL